MSAFINKFCLFIPWGVMKVGYYDHAKICGFVGSYMLNQLKHDMNKESMGLY